MAMHFPFDPDIANASTIPSRLYNDPVYLELEQSQIFSKTWQLVGRTEQVAESGSRCAVITTSACIAPGPWPPAAASARPCSASATAGHTTCGEDCCARPTWRRTRTLARATFICSRCRSPHGYRSSSPISISRRSRCRTSWTISLHAAHSYYRRREEQNNSFTEDEKTRRRGLSPPRRPPS